MKTSQIFGSLIALTLIVGNAACSKKSNAPADDGNRDQDVVTVDGVWATGCAKLPDSSIHLSGTVMIDGQTFKSTSAAFMDSSCSTPLSEPTEATGTYKIVGPSGAVAGAFEIDLDLKFSDGSQKKIYDLVLIEKDTMYFGIYQGLNPASRPTEIDRTMGYKLRKAQEDDDEIPTDLSIVGKWSTGCTQDAGSGFFFASVITADGATIKASSGVYGDATCSWSMGGSEATGTYKIVGPSSAVAGAYELDLDLAFSDGRNEKLYDLVLVENNTLYFGSQQGTNPESRPTAINRDLGYARQP